MMFRKLGSSVVLLLSLLASSALADPDARIRWDVDVKVRQLSDRVVCKFDPANEPVPFNINGTIMDLNPQAYENRVLVTSDLVQVVAFYQEANYVYNHYQGYAGKDLITYLPIPFNGSYNFKMWNNDPDVSIFNYKSALENGNATSTLPLMVYIRPLVSRMMKREPDASLPFTIDRANLPDSIVPFERNQLDVDISNEIAKRISEYEATYGHRRLSKEFSAELAGWLSPLVGRENVPIIAECSRFVSSNASSLDPVHSSEAYFTQTSVYDAETGKIFVYDEVSDKIGVGSDLNQPQGMPLISHARCVPMKWCPCTVLNGCLPFCNGSLPFCNGTITLAKPKLTMMKLCRCQHRTLLALAFDDGRIFMYDPFLCGVVNIIERRCRCTRYLVYPVWMEWCCRTNRLIVQYEKRTRLVVDEEEAIEIHGREAHMTTQQILNELANQFAEDVDHDLSEALNRVRARPNKHFINVYKFDELVRLASEPALEYTIRACNIKFVRYCCCSGHLFVVHQQNLHMAIVVFDRNMRIVARKIVLDPIEKFEVTCCPPKSEQYAGCACVVYMVTSPRLPNMEPVDPENPYRLNVLCVRKVLDIQLLAEYAGDLEICSEFIDVQAHAAAEFIIDLELPLLLSDS